MRHTLSIACMCAMQSICAQWSENFDRGLDPAWSGDTSHFIINSQKELQLNTAQAGNSSLWRKFSTNRAIEWELSVGLDFSPSINNKLEIYLFSDTCSTQAGLAGIIEVGENGNLDTWKFYLRKNGSKSLISSGEEGLLAQGPLNFTLKFILEQDSTWKVFVEVPKGSGQVKENTFEFYVPDLKREMFFGLNCIYSETRSKAFTFDDIYLGEPGKDTMGPVIIHHNLIDLHKIEFIFDETCDTVLSHLEQTVFIDNQKAHWHWKNFKTLQLVAPNQFNNDQIYRLDYSNIYDRQGNKTKDASYEFKTEFISNPKYHEILITEILPDPTPSAGLPEKEFIELFNNTSKPLELLSCKLYDSGSFIQFPQFVIGPGEYLILCNYSDSVSFKPFGKLLPLPSLPSLNNDGDELTLRDSSNSLLFTMKYNLSDYGNPDQSEGGYSLELVNLNSLCSKNQNWKASKSISGGTPGQQNSWNETEADLLGPQLLSINPLSEWEIKLIFDESLEPDLPLHLNRFSLVPDRSIASIEFSDRQYSEIIILLHQPLESGIDYKLNFNGLQDCLGNTSNGQSPVFGRLEVPGWQDLVFSEVLFNAYSNHYDFIELYNRSSKFISLSGLVISNQLNDGLWYALNSDRTIAPNSYMAFTKDPQDLINVYPKGKINAVVSTEIPPMGDEGAVLLLSYRKWPEVQLLDSAVCDQSWHNPFLKEDEGVSLEKVNFDIPSALRSGWESAAESYGFATPGTANSHSWTQISSEFDKPYLIHPKVFSPDNDGVDDLVWINFQDIEPGYKCAIDIFDVSGLFLNRIFNGIPATREIMSWNGISYEGTQSIPGNYIMVIQLLNAAGKKSVFKELISLVY